MESSTRKKNILKTIVPPITGLVDEAYPLIVALPHDRAWDWFYSNYIQVVFKNDDQMGYNVRFYKTDHRGIMWDTLNPWINYNIINMNFMKALKMDILDLIVRSVDSGYYMTVYLDRFYIPGIRNYQKSHMTHEAMIFGYDLENERIHMMEYTETYLSEFDISFQEFRDAYDNCDQSRYEEVHLLKFDQQRHYEFDLINVSEQLNDYLTSQNTSERYRINSNPVYSPFVTFGLDLYNIVRQYLDVNRLDYDIRVFNSIWEHKKVMKERVQYMADQNYVENISDLFQPCKDIEDKSILLKSQFMRLCATKRDKTLVKIFELLDDMERMELEVYGELKKRVDKQIELNREQNPEIWYSNCAFTQGTRSLDFSDDRKLTIEFDLNTNNKIMDGVIGYSDSKNQVVAYSSLFVMLKLNLDGNFSAIDGDNFRSLEEISYTANGSYRVHIEVDFNKGTYDLSIQSENHQAKVADKFKFNSLVLEPADIDKISLVSDNMSLFTIANHEILSK